jgi:sulfite reductase (NADPH) hemoprotein beta-component
MGPGFGEHEIVGAVERVVDHYLQVREPGERFLDTYRRIGMEPFKNVAYREQLYAAHTG